MAKTENFKGVHCGDNKDLDEYLNESYLECYSLLDNICEAINERYWTVLDYFYDMAEDGTTNSNEMYNFVFGEFREYVGEVSKYAGDVAVFQSKECREKGCTDWMSILADRDEGKNYTEAIGLSLADFKDKYLGELDFSGQIERLPSYTYNIDGVEWRLEYLYELDLLCKFYVVNRFNTALKHIRVNVDRLLNGKGVGFEDWQYSFDFAGAKSKIANGANNIFQSLFSKRKVFINEDLYKKIEDDVIKTHKKADDIVNEIISKHYNGVNAENPTTTNEEQQVSDVEGDMAQIDAMLKDLNSEEAQAPTVEVASEEKPQSTQGVTEAIDNAQGSITDSLEEEFRKLKESLGLD